MLADRVKLEKNTAEAICINDKTTRKNSKWERKVWEKENTVLVGVIWPANQPIGRSVLAGCPQVQTVFGSFVLEAHYKGN